MAETSKQKSSIDRSKPKSIFSKGPVLEFPALLHEIHNSDLLYKNNYFTISSQNELSVDFDFDFFENELKLIHVEFSINDYFNNQDQVLSANKPSLITQDSQIETNQLITPHPENISACFDQKPSKIIKKHFDSFQIMKGRSQNFEEEKSNDFFSKEANLHQLTITKTANVNSAQKTSVGCNCQKSMCLKLYCECFLNGNICVPSCKCKNCKNSEECGDLRKMVTETLLGKKQTFKKLQILRKNKLKEIYCTCRKSNCRQKYCECLKHGKKCGQKCICVDCENGNCGNHKSNENIVFDDSVAKAGKITKKIKKKENAEILTKNG